MIDKCPWCNASVQTDRMLGCGYVPRWDPPRVEWTCGSGCLSNDDEPMQSAKCIAIVFREVEELRGEIQRTMKQRDDLLWFLHAEFMKRHPIMIEPDWLTETENARKVAGDNSV